MNILVTGATGFVGHHIVRHLAKQMAADASDGEVVAVTRRTPEPNLAIKGVRWIRISDLGPDTDWRSALDGVDAIVHCAGVAQVSAHPTEDELQVLHSVNVAGTRQLATAAVEHGVERLVFLSSLKVHGETTTGRAPFSTDDVPAPQDAYGRSKLAAEASLMEVADRGDLSVVVLRPPLVYGEGVQGNFRALLRAVQLGVPLPFGRVRNNRRSLIYVGNLVGAIWAALTMPRPSEAPIRCTTTVSDADDLSTAALLEALAQASHQLPLLVPVPQRAMRWAAQALDRTAVADRLLGSLQVNPNDMQRLLGFQPIFSASEGIWRTVRCGLTTR